MHCVVSALVVAHLVYVLRGQTEGDLGETYTDYGEYTQDFDIIDSDDSDDIDTALGKEPTFEITKFNLTVTAGHDAMLPCSIDNLGNYKTTWLDQNGMVLTFEERRIVDDPRFGIVKDYTTQWTLLIREIQLEDRGTYMCQINTNPVLTKTIVLNVNVPASIVDELSSDDVTTVEGSDVVLVCNVTGTPRPTVKWFRYPSAAKGRPAQTYGSLAEKGEVVGGDNSGEILLIRNITRYCEAVYQCEADNNVPPKVTRRMKVTVDFAPEVTLSTQRIGQAYNQETILECHITAQPLNVNYWMKNGRRINSHLSKYKIDAYTAGDHTITLSLRIVRLQHSDYGAYVCVAENKYGSNRRTMRLYRIHTRRPHSKNRPTKPTNADDSLQQDTSTRSTAQRKPGYRNYGRKHAADENNRGASDTGNRIGSSKGEENCSVRRNISILTIALFTCIAGDNYYYYY